MSNFGLCACGFDVELSWVQKEAYLNAIGVFIGWNGEVEGMCFNYITHGHVDYLNPITTKEEFRDMLLASYETYFSAVQGLDNFKIIALYRYCIEERKKFAEKIYSTTLRDAQGRRIIFK